MNKNVEIRDLSRMAYGDAWEYQEELFQGIIDTKITNRRENAGEETNNYLLFVEHPHVYTLGKSGDVAHLLVNDDFLNKIKATYFKTNRGGDITYHGPGQIVGYPILDLENFFTDIHRYLRELEEIFIRILSDYDLKGERSPGETGVWLDVGKSTARKICAMGVRSSRWVTMHGFAFNVNTDLSYFKHIVPCGIQDKAVTSLQKELGRELNIQEVKEKILRYFSEGFEATIK